MPLLIWFPTICCLMYVVTSTSVASESCKTNALNIARNLYHKRRLRSRVIESQPISEPIDCHLKCMKNCRCISYNVCNGGKLCELNSEKKACNISLYETHDDCDYHEFIFNNKQSKGCKDTCCFSSQPCLNGGPCQATCMENGIRFQCHCLEGHNGERCENVASQPTTTSASLRTASFPRSCSFYAKSSNRTHGLRQIYSPDNKPYNVFCYFSNYYTHTLAMSYSLENKAYFDRQPLTNDFPVSEDSPNWTKYRLSFARMAALRDVAIKWKIACSYNLHGMRDLDWLKVKIKRLDPLGSQTGVKCPAVENVRVKGVGCDNCMIALTQGSNAWHMMHHHANFCPSHVVKVLPKKSCSSGDFSYFGNYNTKCIDGNHSCSSSTQATTQLWFLTYP